MFSSNFGGSSKKGNKNSLSETLIDGDATATKSGSGDNNDDNNEEDYEYDNTNNNDSFGNQSPLKGGSGKDVIEAPKGRISFKKKNEPKYESRLEKINNNKVTFDIPPKTEAMKVTYYNSDIMKAPKYDQINALGTTDIVAENTLVVGAKKTVSQLEDKPQDNSEARIARVKEFEEAANRRISPANDFDNFNECLIQGEKIICSLNCSLVSGLPNVTEDCVIAGTIKVSLVGSGVAGEGYRLLFSVADGWKELSVFEEFIQTESIWSCTCCFYKIENDMAQTKLMASSATLKYSTKRSLNAQFTTLPVKLCVVDSSTYRSAADEFYAVSQSGAVGKSQTICETIAEYCTICFAACCNAPCCECCGGGGESGLCCGSSTSNDLKMVKFEAKQSKNLNDETDAFPPIIGESAPEIDGLTFTVSASNQDYVYVLIHYRSLLDMSYRTCKLKVAQTESPSESYKIAKKFVSIICSEKSQYDASYFANSMLSLKMAPHTRVMFRGEENLTVEGLERARQEQELAFSGGNTFWYNTTKCLRSCNRIVTCGGCCKSCCNCCGCCGKEVSTVKK